MKKKLNVGMIGFGGIGKAHAYSYATIPFYYGKMPVDVHLKVVCTSNETSAKKARDNYGFEHGTWDMDDFFENYDLDIVHICTPNEIHLPNILKAVEKNCHIYCEKPLTLNYSESLKVQKATENYDKTCHMVFNNRYFPSVIRAKEIVDSGELGDMVSIRSRYLLSSLLNPDTPATWRVTGDNQGGVLLDLGSHAIDLVHFFGGEFKDISGFTKTFFTNRPDGKGGTVSVTQNDTALAIFNLKNGAYGTVEVSKMIAGASNDMLLEMNFKKGSIRLDFENPNLLHVYREDFRDKPYGGDKGYTAIQCVHRYPERNFPSEKHTLGWARAHVHCVYNFLDNIAKNKVSGATFKDGAYVSLICDKILESEKVGGFVKV